MELNNKIAVDHGVREAVLIQCLKQSIEKNKANGKHRYKAIDSVERTWTSNTFKALEEVLPFWSNRQLQRIIKSLIDQDVLVSDHFNEMKLDRTLWYAFRNEEEFLDL